MSAAAAPRCCEARAAFDHGRWTCQVNLPTRQTAEILHHCLRHEACPQARRCRLVDDEFQAHEAGMYALQTTQLVDHVEVGCGACTDINMQRSSRAQRQHSAHDRQNRREAGSTGNAQRGAGVLAAQIRRAERPLQLDDITAAQTRVDPTARTPLRQAAHVQLQQLAPLPVRERVKACEPRLESDFHELAGTEPQRLVGTQRETGDRSAEPATIENGALQRLRGMVDDLVRLDQPDLAVLTQARAACKNPPTAPWGRSLAKLAVRILDHLAREQLAATHAATTGLAAVRHWQGMLSQHIQQAPADRHHEFDAARLHAQTNDAIVGI